MKAVYDGLEERSLELMIHIGQRQNKLVNDEHDSIKGTYQKATRGGAVTSVQMSTQQSPIKGPMSTASTTSSAGK